MLDWFSRKEAINLKADIHSHLLPELDDGVKTVEETLEILRFFESRGYQKVITTPHINPELFPNTEAAILKARENIEERLSAERLQIKLEVAAEYFICPQFVNALDDHQELLSFGKNYVLIETSFYSKPLIFDEVVFKMKANGYTPVLAHPERYQYLVNDFVWLKDIREKGVKLQVTWGSLVGMYDKAPKLMAEKLLKNQMVDFLGSDIHRTAQVRFLDDALNLKVKPQNLLNNELI